MLSFLSRWICTVGLMACSFMVPAGELTVSAAASLTDARPWRESRRRPHGGAVIR